MNNKKLLHFGIRWEERVMDLIVGVKKREEADTLQHFRLLQRV
jgi:hypothetical protein